MQLYYAVSIISYPTVVTIYKQDAVSHFNFTFLPGHIVTKFIMLFSEHHSSHYLQDFFWSNPMQKLQTSTPPWKLYMYLRKHIHIDNLQPRKVKQLRFQAGTQNSTLPDSTDLASSLNVLITQFVFHYPFSFCVSPARFLHMLWRRVVIPLTFFYLSYISN